MPSAKMSVRKGRRSDEVLARAAVIYERLLHSEATRAEEARLTQVAPHPRPAWLRQGLQPGARRPPQLMIANHRFTDTKPI